MTAVLSLTTLQLCRTLLSQQSISINASRQEVAAILDARDELDQAITHALTEAAPNTEDPSHG